MRYGGHGVAKGLHDPARPGHDRRGPAGLALDQHFVNGVRQPMARYPDFNSAVRPYNGFAADAFSPQRAKNFWYASFIFW